MKGWTFEDIERLQSKGSTYAATKFAKITPPPSVAPSELKPPKKSKMNKTESAYSMLLEAKKQTGEISWYEFEAMNLRLADNTYYRPDFAVLTSVGNIEFHEVKGFWRDDAKVKIKVAARLFPFRFLAVYMKGGRFEYQEF